MPAPRGLLPTVLAIGLTVASGPLVAGQTDPSPQVPQTLAEPAHDLEAALAELSQAEDLEEARQLHRERVEPTATALMPYAADLAGEDGRLLATYLERLAERLEAGNLTDARSLAGAAADLVRDELLDVAERWDANRTALMAGPLEATDDGWRVSLVLVHPPPSGIAAFDAELAIPEATPREAAVELGQGQTRLDPANGTVRWASFDARSTARLSPQGADRVVLGQATLEPDTPSDTERLATQASVFEVLDPEGREVPVVGLDGARQIPEEGADGASRGWLALAGLGLAATGVGLWVRRWEV